MKKQEVMSITEQRELGLVTQRAGVYGAMYDGNVVYIGSTNDLMKRQSTHKSSLKGGYHSNKGLQNLYDSLEDKDDLVFTVLMSVSEYNEKQLFRLEDNLMKVHSKTILNKNQIRQKEKLFRTKEEQAEISEIFSKANSGTNNPMARLSEADAKKIIKLKADGVKTKIIAEEYDISQNYVSRIGKDRWSHLA